MANAKCWMYNYNYEKGYVMSLRNQLTVYGLILFTGMALGTMLDRFGGDSAAIKSAHDTTNGQFGRYVVEAKDAPSVSMEVKEDGQTGWNVIITTSNFRFAPEMIYSPNKLGEGHAYLYVDGKRVARLYAPFYHYAENFNGKRTFRVTLNANDHSEYSNADGSSIESVVEVVHEAHN